MNEEFGSKRYKSVWINWSKKVFSLPRKWQPLFSVSNFHIASLGYNNIKNVNTDFYFQRFIIKTDPPNALNPLHVFFSSKCNKSNLINITVIFHIETVENTQQSKLIHI